MLPRLALEPRRLLYLALGLVALLAGDRLGLAGWGTALLLSPILVIEALLRLRLQVLLPRFRTLLLARLQDGAGLAELLDLYRRQTLLRFAAPRHEMLAWLGRIHGHWGQHALAVQAYTRALEEAPRNAAPALALSLGDSLYQQGELDLAERTYRQGLTEEHRSSRACANLARIILARGGDPEEAASYLQLAVEADRGGELRLEHAELLLALGRTDDARWQVELADEELRAAGAGQTALDRLSALRSRLP